MINKSISFAEYINRDWMNFNKISFKEGRGLDYAGSDAVSKVPILFNFDEDWAFLSQFPPKMWKLALQWRYSEGLLYASEAREKHSRKHISAVPDWMPDGVTLKEGGNEHHFTGEPNKGIFVGFNKMFQRFEKPVKTKSEPFQGQDYGYSPQADADGPSIHDVDVFAKTPEEAREHEGKKMLHRDAYKGGTIGADLSRPQKITPELVDMIPDDDPLIANNRRRGEDIADTKARLKKTPPHSVAGMSAMQEKTAGEKMQMWVKAQGLGLLGQLNVGDKIKDPVSGQEIPIIGVESPQAMNGFWKGSVGKDDESQWAPAEGQIVKGGKKEVKVPIVKKYVYPWTTTYPNGKTKTNPGKNYDMPVLLSQVMLPRIPITPEQKELFKKRNSGNSELGADELLKNIDLLSPEQFKYLKDNSMDQLHAAAYHASKSKFQDKYDKSLHMNYNLGWDATNNTAGIKPHHLTKEQMQNVIKEYVPESSTRLKHETQFINKNTPECIRNYEILGCSGGGLVGEAYEGIMSFMIGKLGYNPKTGGGNKGSFGSLEMMEAALNPLIQACAYKLALKLNDEEMGVYDPELGLTNLSPEFINNPKGPWSRRVNFAREFARELEQTSLFDSKYGTRRSRKKAAEQGLGRSREITMSSLNKDDNDWAGNAAHAGLDKKSSDEFDYEDDSEGTQATKERDRILQGTATEKERTGWMSPDVDKIARKGWLGPSGLGKEFDYLLNGVRHDIAKYAGTEFAVSVYRAKEAIRRAPAIWEKLVEDKERELAPKIENGLQRRKAAEKEVQSIFQKELVRIEPELYAPLTQDQMEEVMKNYKKKHQSDKPVEEKEETEQEIAANGGITRDMMSQLVELNTDFLESMLKYGSGNMYNLDKSNKIDIKPTIVEPEFTMQEFAKEFAAPESLKNFIENDLKLGRNGVNKYFVKIWMAMAKEKNAPVSQPEAIQIAQKLGYSPVEANQQAAPVTAKPVAQQPAFQMAAKNVDNLMSYASTPEQPGETPDQIVAKINELLKTITPNEKVSLKTLFDQLKIKIHQQNSWSKKDQIVLRKIGGFLSGNTPV